eukprot:jgi/Chlat1/6304/Chrsp44S05881
MLAMLALPQCMATPTMAPLLVWKAWRRPSPQAVYMHQESAATWPQSALQLQLRLIHGPSSPPFMPTHAAQLPAAATPMPASSTPAATPAPAKQAASRAKPATRRKTTRKGSADTEPGAEQRMRDASWSAAESKSLVRAWGAINSRTQQGGAYQKNKHFAIKWSDIMVHLKEIEDRNWTRTIDQCQSRWFTLKSQHSTVRGYMSQSGKPNYFETSDEEKVAYNWQRNLLMNDEELFQELEHALGDSHSAEPPFSGSTFDDNEGGSTLNDMTEHTTGKKKKKRTSIGSTMREVHREMADTMRSMQAAEHELLEKMSQREAEVLREGFASMADAIRFLK